MDAESETTTLSPEDAFATLGNGTRIAVLRSLGNAEGGPLSFGELPDAVDMRDSGQFNYHLDKLTGHFVEKTDEGYELRRAGERIVEAVLSGAVTDDPIVERTEIDHVCHYCGGTLELSFAQESTATFCTECSGAFDKSAQPDDESVPGDDLGFMGYLHLPPAGLAKRTPTEIHEVAFTWQLSENLPAANGVCPRCSAALDESVSACEDHHADEGTCEVCSSRHAIQYTAECTNCIFNMSGPFSNKLTGSTELIDFLSDHGINPVAPSPERAGSVVLDYNETVVSTAPFEGRFTFTLEGDAIHLAVDDDLEVIAANRDESSD